jgi:hypothetical protein
MPQRTSIVSSLDHEGGDDIGITRGEAEREARRPFWSDGVDPS